MDKKVLLIVLILIVIAVLVLVNRRPKVKVDNTPQEIQNETTIEVAKEPETIKIKVNNQVLDLELEKNSTVEAFMEKLKEKDVVVDAHDYHNFEKVGSLGFSLPRDDKNLTTQPGDIVLYQGNQVCIFYNSNTYDYTKLGRVKNANLKEILGDGDVTLIFTYVNNDETLYD